MKAPPLRRRLACLIYEGLMLLGIALVTSAVSLGLLRLLGLEQGTNLHRLALQAMEFIVLTGYGAGFWSGGRQTLPMKVWKIAVVAKSGAPLGVGRALWRAILAWLWVLPALLAAAALHLSPSSTAWLVAAGLLLWAAASQLRPDHQFLHDGLAGTRLIQDSI
ncbi:RDD family protein [Thiomonas intermedia]|uniref:RDD family protein n=1 Tax=Thiomonas intermedia TaxID=926 RepID=UPI001FEBC107|nr:RDD family protein [Thiomonas intermedia]